MNTNALTPADHYSWLQLLESLNAAEYSDAFIADIYRLAIASSYALTQLAARPEQLQNLRDMEEFHLDQFPDSISCNQPIDLLAVKQQLRQYRHCKLIEIIYLDVIRQTPLKQILGYLSDLADRLITQALDACEKHLSARHGQPVDADGHAMQLSIIAMGKLGGRELNFSSDIDLICCYPGDGQLQGFGQLSYQEYFNRVVRLLTQCLSEVTEDGFVYRVDLRLRPWGSAGPAVLSYASMEHYYQLHGREWERYAMVKARVLSGSSSDREYLASLIRPFVYRKYHDYRVFEGLATLKDKINYEAQSQNMHENIKLGPGGIREVEFFVQAFQILKGGRNHQLQSAAIFHCFEVLERQSIVPAQTLQDLRAGYIYLRRLENKIQMLADEQSHQLPTDALSRQRISHALGARHWQDVQQQQQQHRSQISAHFNQLFRPETEPEQNADLLMEEASSEDSNRSGKIAFLRRLGILQADAAQQQIEQFALGRDCYAMSAKAKKRFSTLLPGLLRAVAKSHQPLVLLQRLLKLFSSIAGRSVYFELLHQNENLRAKLIDLFDNSAWLADEVANYPMLLEPLIQSGDLAARFNREHLEKGLNVQLDNAADDTELELDILRLFKREQTIVIATAELAEEISTVEVGGYLSDLAEILLAAVYRLAKQSIEKQYGQAYCGEPMDKSVAEFAIIGYGKLGGREMHYQSDLDIIFLHNSSGSFQQSNGPKTIDNNLYYARLAQKIISTLNLATGTGRLYEIDLRLRPDGNAGLLVSSTQAYYNYQLEKAWTWEHQALVRARPVAGSKVIAEEFKNMRQHILTQPREANYLRQEILAMREKIYQNQKPREDEYTDLKHARGCMIDIEFMIQYWVLLHAKKINSIHRYSDSIHLLKELIRLNIVTDAQTPLIAIYSIYHRYLHQTVLQNMPAEIESTLIQAEVTQVLQSWQRCFNLYPGSES